MAAEQQQGERVVDGRHRARARRVQRGDAPPRAGGGRSRCATVSIQPAGGDGDQPAARVVRHPLGRPLPARPPAAPPGRRPRRCRSRRSGGPARRGPAARARAAGPRRRSRSRRPAAQCRGPAAPRPGRTAASGTRAAISTARSRLVALDQVEAGEVLLDLGERAVGGDRLPVAPRTRRPGTDRPAPSETISSPDAASSSTRAVWALTPSCRSVSDMPCHASRACSLWLIRIRYFTAPPRSEMIVPPVGQNQHRRIDTIQNRSSAWVSRRGGRVPRRFSQWGRRHRVSWSARAAEMEFVLSSSGVSRVLIPGRRRTP